MGWDALTQAIARGVVEDIERGDWERAERWANALFCRAARFARVPPDDERGPES